jgi:uncharacterized protein (TIGR03083 family)
MKRPPIDIIDLFPLLNAKLISFLKDLPAEDWQRQTVAKQWKIKDVVAHLVDGNYRQLALKRDGWIVQPDVEIRSYADLVNYLNQFNADWVKAAKRLSPDILIEMLEDTNEKVFQTYKDLDPFAKAIYPVSWAGEEESQNWFDIAREYTERWLHQQQIRDAMGDGGILTKELYYPVLNIFLYAWPFTCKDTKAEEGTILKTTITGKGGGEWLLKMENGKWEIGNAASTRIVAETIIDGNLAWKLFSKSVRKEDIKGGFEIKGDRQLGEKVLEMISVMA